MSVKCLKCHTDNPDTATFCADCGTRIISPKEIDVTETIEAPKEELTTGATFAGRYQIIEELGKGGMGKVYKVHDTEIKEKVALKLLKPEISADEKTIERFRNEIKLARKIAHRNVCKMFDLGEDKGTRFITMEYVEGEDLKSMIRMVGQLSKGKAISIAKQVCEGLVEAHSLGIVHRDLKPSNIMIDKFGNAKIMDFGIARSLKAKGITGTGVMIGTPEYMSPEQVEGKEIDQRTDIYSLGVILYEMATGQVPFEGETAFSVVMKHKSEKPKSPRELNTQIGIDLNNLILKCMEKDKEYRYQNIEELIADLTQVERQIPTTERVVPKRKPVTSREITVKLSLKRLYIPVLALIALAVLIGVSILLIKRKPQTKPLLPQHKQLTFTGNVSHSAISPDGKFIAFGTSQEGQGYKLFVQDMVTGHSIEVLNAERIYGNPHWTPNGSEITVFAMKESKWGTYLVSRLGGQPHRISDHEVCSWSPDGSQFAVTKQLEFDKGEIIIVNRSSGDSTSLNLGEPIWICDNIDWSPSSDRLLLNIRKKEPLHTIWTIKLDGTQKNKVVEGSWFESPTWSSKGDAIYYTHAKGEDQSGIWKIPISQKTGKTTKSPSLVLPNIEVASFSLTDDGKYLLYTRRIGYSNLWLAKIEESKKTQTAKTKQLTSGTFSHSTPNISPDGKLVAFSKGKDEVHNIYVMPIEGGNPTQLTFFNFENRNPALSPDGEEIAFGSNKGGEFRVWKVSAQGGRPYQFSKTDLAYDYEIVWAPNPNIIYKKRGFQNYNILNPKTEEETPLFKDEPAGYCFNAHLSPDGKKFTVRASRQTSDMETVVFDIWMINLVDSTQKSLFESESYVVPIGWSRDGNWIYAYESKENQVNYFKIEVKSGQTQILPTLPFIIEGKTRYKVIDFGPEIIVGGQSQSDVWIIENFDPDIK